MQEHLPIAIQVAVHEEISPVLKRLAVEEVFHEVTWEQRRSLKHAHHDHLRFYVGMMNGVRVVVFRTGVGRLRANEIIRVFFEHFEPKLLISAGFGGALNSDLDIGDIVLVNDILELQTGRSDWQSLVPSLNGQFKFQQGRIVTADQMVISGSEKTALGAKHNALVVDMETSAVATKCKKHGVPIVGIRAISDRANEDLPPEINTFFDNGEVRPGKIAKAIFSHPPTIVGLFKLAKHAWKAGEDLADFLEKFVVGVSSGLK